MNFEAVESFMYNMNIKVIRSKRKTISIQIRSSDEIIIRAPLRMPMRDIQSFIDRNKGWIDINLKKFEKREEDLKSISPLTEMEIQELIENAKRVIKQRVDYYAPIVGVDYGRITIRNQKTRWGSCSSKGNLNFNVALMRMPLEVLDYVVVHELCHRIEMNHSPRFWKEVERIIPDYKKHEKYLKEQGHKVMAEVRL